MTPRTPADPDTDPVELGLQFSVKTDGLITAIRFYKSDANAGPHSGTLWSPEGRRLAQVQFPDHAGSGWQQAKLASPVAVKAGPVYTASYHAPEGRYAADQKALSPEEPVVTRDLTALRGVYSYEDNTLPKADLERRQLLRRRCLLTGHDTLPQPHVVTHVITLDVPHDVTLVVTHDD